MKVISLLFITSLSLALGQYEEGMTPKQASLYKQMASSVAAPCCSNAIPVAFHESSMAFEIREHIANWVKEGRSEREILKALDELRIGPEQLPVTFTIPDRNSLGFLAWASPVLIIAIGIFAFYMLQVRLKRPTEKLSDDELVEQYRPLIQKELQKIS